MFNSTIYATDEINSLQSKVLVARDAYSKALASDSVREQSNAMTALDKAIEDYNTAVKTAVYEYCKTTEYPVETLLKGGLMPYMKVMVKSGNKGTTVSVDTRRRLVDIADFLDNSYTLMDDCNVVNWHGQCELLREIACGNVGMQLAGNDATRFGNEFMDKFRMKYNPDARLIDGSAKMRYTRSAVKTAAQAVVDCLLGKGRYTVKTADISGIVYTITRVDTRNIATYKFPNADAFVKTTLVAVLTGIVNNVNANIAYSGKPAPKAD